jgi:hypothetical protein
MICWAFVVLKLFHLRVIVSPVFEKRRLVGTDVAGTNGILQAALHTAENLAAISPTQERVCIPWYDSDVKTSLKFTLTSVVKLGADSAVDDTMLVSLVEMGLEVEVDGCRSDEPVAKHCTAESVERS